MRITAYNLVLTDCNEPNLDLPSSEEEEEVTEDNRRWVYMIV